MSMKKPDLEKNKLLKTRNALKRSGIPDRYGIGSVIEDRKAQRKLDQAAGLTPFACKLPSPLIAEMHARAERDGQPLNDWLAAVLAKALQHK